MTHNTTHPLADRKIRYENSIINITSDDLKGFFVGWPNPPSPEVHLRLLDRSDYRWLAVDEASGHVVGFITAISDQVLCAYIPLLEVLPEYQGLDIGRQLVERMLETLKDYYMVDLLCDAELQPFYRKMGLHPTTGMLKRNYERQSGGE